MRKDYTVTTDWKGKQYIGITLDWDYKRKRVHLTMPKYAKTSEGSHCPRNQVWDASRRTGSFGWLNECDV